MCVSRQHTRSRSRARAHSFTHKRKHTQCVFPRVAAGFQWPSVKQQQFGHGRGLSFSLQCPGHLTPCLYGLTEGDRDSRLKKSIVDKNGENPCESCIFFFFTGQRMNFCGCVRHIVGLGSSRCCIREILVP